MLIVSASSQITEMLALNLCPITDNLQALISMGFKRQFPGVTSGEKAYKWVRKADLGYAQKGISFARQSKKEYAYLSFIAQNDADAQAPANKAAALREKHVLNNSIIAEGITIRNRTAA